MATVRMSMMKWHDPDYPHGFVLSDGEIVECPQAWRVKVDGDTFGYVVRTRWGLTRLDMAHRKIDCWHTGCKPRYLAEKFGKLVMC